MLIKIIASAELKSDPKRPLRIPLIAKTDVSFDKIKYTTLDSAYKIMKIIEKQTALVSADDISNIT